MQYFSIFRPFCRTTTKGNLGVGVLCTIWQWWPQDYTSILSSFYTAHWFIFCQKCKVILILNHGFSSIYYLKLVTNAHDSIKIPQCVTSRRSFSAGRGSYIWNLLQSNFHILFFQLSLSSIKIQGEKYLVLVFFIAQIFFSFQEIWKLLGWRTENDSNN